MKKQATRLLIAAVFFTFAIVGAFAPLETADAAPETTLASEQAPVQMTDIILLASR